MECGLAAHRWHTSLAEGLYTQALLWLYPSCWPPLNLDHHRRTYLVHRGYTEACEQSFCHSLDNVHLPSKYATKIVLHIFCPTDPNLSAQWLLICSMNRYITRSAHNTSSALAGLRQKEYKISSRLEWYLERSRAAHSEL